jgi:beta-glucanase (GH16 family)
VAWAADIAARNGGSAPPWSGGLLMTDTRRSTERFGYGYYAVRARLPLPGKGMFPALWLFAANGQNPGKENAEIDLLEVFGQPTGAPWSITLHHKQLGGTAAAGATTSSGQVAVATVPSSTTDWHTYALDWQSGHLRFYRDDVLVAEVTGAAAQFYNGVTMGLRLNYAADAAWFAADRLSDASTPDRLAMDVDWVRVWATKP